jgi:hypothetical protein
MKSYPYWTTPVTNAPVLPDIAAKISKVAGAGIHCEFGVSYNGRYNGIPVLLVHGNTDPRVKFTVQPVGNQAESDMDRTMVPLPAALVANPASMAIIEGDKYPTPLNPDPDAEGYRDRHMIVYDVDNDVSWEMANTYRPGEQGPTWSCSYLAYWDYKNQSYRRPEGWSSADAAGLPILPGLVRYEEMMERMNAGFEDLGHPIRVTFGITTRAYVFPASHYTSSGTTTPDWMRMGERLRLRQTFFGGKTADNYCDGAIQSPNDINVRINRMLIKTMQNYGLIVADNGGNGFISGSPHENWNSDTLAWLKQFVRMSDFDVVDGNAVAPPPPPPPPPPPLPVAPLKLIADNASPTGVFVNLFVGGGDLNARVELGRVTKPAGSKEPTVTRLSNPRHFQVTAFAAGEYTFIASQTVGGLTANSEPKSVTFVQKVQRQELTAID